MEKRIKLSIKEPCSEKFENFSPTVKGGFCSSCEKEVIDFSKMDRETIQQHFRTANSKTCGRFEVKQIDRFNYAPTLPSKRRKFAYVGALSFAFLGLFASNELKAQDQMKVTLHQSLEDNVGLEETIEDGLFVRGNVSSENEPLPFVSIYLQGSDVGVVSDFDGNFSFPERVKPGDSLVFSYLGYKTVVYTVPEILPTRISVIMPEAECYLTGEVSVEGVYEPRASLWQKIRSLF